MGIANVQTVRFSCWQAKLFNKPYTECVKPYNSLKIVLGELLAVFVCFDSVSVQ